MRTPNYPHRPTGKRPPPPTGIPLKQRQRRAKKARPSVARRVVDPIVCRHARGWETPDYLQASAEQTLLMCLEIKREPLFGVSGWIVVGPEDPLPEGYARLSELASQGFQVVPTPELGRRGHVTIVLSEPVDLEQAHRLNATFGRAHP